MYRTPAVGSWRQRNAFASFVAWPPAAQRGLPPSARVAHSVRTFLLSRVDGAFLSSRRASALPPPICCACAARIAGILMMARRVCSAPHCQTWIGSGREALGPSGLCLMATLLRSFSPFPLGKLILRLWAFGILTSWMMSWWTAHGRRFAKACFRATGCPPSWEQ